jgi:hypothetical protein
LEICFRSEPGRATTNPKKNRKLSVSKKKNRKQKKYSTVLTPADKEHQLPEQVVMQLNQLIEGDAAVSFVFRFFVFILRFFLSSLRSSHFFFLFFPSTQATLAFDQCAWWFSATGMEGTAHFFKLLGGAARASGCQTADFLIKRGAMPEFGKGGGSIPVVGASMFSSSTQADITHAATLALAMAKTEFNTYNSLEQHANADSHLSDFISNKVRH